MVNSHGFSIEWLKLPPGGSLSRHKLAQKQALVVYQGELTINVEGAAVGILAKGQPSGWDSFAMPADCWRSYSNAGAQDAVVLMISAGDMRKRIAWADDVVRAAGDRGQAIDANGFMGPKYFIDRAQN